MELLSNEIEDWPENPKAVQGLKAKETKGRSRNGNSLEMDEAELCDTYGYELAMSPAETVMPDDADQSWVSEDSDQSETTNMLKMTTELEDFDLLEPFLLESRRSSKHSEKVSEISWFSEDSSDSQTSFVKMCAEEFDELETCIFQSEYPSKPPVDTENDDGRPANPPENAYYTANDPIGHDSQQLSSEKSIADTTILVQSLVRRMTLGQKMKFYAWFNSGLSIDNAALISKIPDLTPPSVRHQNCKFSKRRLQRLSKILPNVFLRRQFIHETYFGGVDSKQMMRYLLMGLGSENLMATFECQFALEEHAFKEKLLRRKICNSTAASATADAPTAVDSPDTPRDPDLEVRAENTNSEINLRRTNGIRLKGEELKKFYFWRKQGLSVTEAVSKAKDSGLSQEIVPHPDCKYSWEKLQHIAKALPNKNSVEIFLAKVYYEGKDPGEVWKAILSGGNECQPSESNRVVESGSFAEQNLLSENVTDIDTVGSPVDAAKVHITKPDPSVGVIMKAAETSASAEVSTEESVYQQRSTKTQHSAPRQEELSSENHTVIKAANVSNEEHCSNISNTTTGLKQGADAEPRSSDGDPKIPRMSLNQLKRYYKWRNQGSIHSEALVKAQTRKLIPESISHPGCKHSWEEVEDMSDKILHKYKRLIFQIEVFYGGKRPEDVMKKMLSSDSKHGSLKSNCTTPHSVCGSPFVAQSVNPSKSSHTNADSVDPQPVEHTESGYMSSVSDHQPADEDDSTLSKFRRNQRKELHNRVLSSVEALTTSKLPGGVPGFKGPHPDGKKSWREIKEMASALPTRSAKRRFKVEAFFGGKDPSELLKRMKTDSGANEDTQASEPNVQTTAGLNSFDNNTHYTTPLFHQNGPAIENTIPGETGKTQRGSKTSKSVEIDDVTSSSQEDSVMELGNHNLKKYYVWRNKGLSHVDAISKTKNKMDNLSVKEMNELLVAHRNCKHSWDELVQMSFALPEKNLRDRFFTHTFHGGVDPKYAMKLLNSRIPQLYLPNGGHTTKNRRKLVEKMKIEYLMRKGLTREDALKKLRKPSKTLLKELKEAIHVNCSKNQVKQTTLSSLPTDNSLNLGNRTELTKIPLSSTVARSVVSQETSENPWLPSEKSHDVVPYPVYPVEIPPAVTPAFVNNELSYPDPALQLQGSQGQSDAYGPADLPTVFPSAFQVQAASLPSMTYSGCIEPGGSCHPLDQQNLQHMNDSVDPSREIAASSDEASLSSKGEPPNAKNFVLGDNEVQCFIVSADFPNRILTEPQMDAIENNLLEAILEMDDDNMEPSFRDSFRSNGRFGFICNDEFSVDWLFKYLRVYEPWDGASLRLITEQSAKIRANAILPSCKGDDDCKILKFIERQNVGLNVSKWTVVQRWDSSDGNTFMDLIIDEDSADILQKCGKISFKLGSAEIVTCQKVGSPSACIVGDSNHVADSPKRQSPLASLPPLPMSPLPSSLPPPPPSPSPSTKPWLIDTSLGALLKISASSSHDSPRETRQAFDNTILGTSFPEEVSGKRGLTKDRSYSRERMRSRCSPMDHSDRSRYHSPGRTHKRRWSEKYCNRAASRSPSQEKERNMCRKYIKEDSKCYASRLPLPERSRPKDCSGKNCAWLGDEKCFPDKFLTDPKHAPLSPIRSCSFISSEDNLSLPDYEPHPNSLHKRVGSFKNIENVLHLENTSISKPHSMDLFDLTDST